MSAQRGLDACPSDAELLRRYEAQQRAPDDKIRARALGWPIRTSPAIQRNTVAFVQGQRIVGQIVNLAPEWPIRLTLPWTTLISDNHKYLIRNGKLYKTVEYREARKRIAAYAKEVMGTAQPASIPLRFEARVYVPNGQRRDVHNLGKCCLDALTGTIFVDDSQLHDVRWIRAGVDVDKPRADIVLSPLTLTPQ